MDRISLLALALALAAEPISGYVVGGGMTRQARAVSSVTLRHASPLAQEGSGVAASAAFIEFIVGYPEPAVPDVKLTRSRDGTTGVATFTFDNPSFLAASSTELGETTGMYLKDSEGTIQTSEVRRSSFQASLVSGSLTERALCTGHCLVHQRQAADCQGRRRHAGRGVLSDRPTCSCHSGPLTHPPRTLAQDEWDRFMRFMERYSASNGLGFSKA